MLSNAYLLAKFRFDRAENERTFAEKCRKNAKNEKSAAAGLGRGAVPASAALMASADPDAYGVT